MLQYNLRLRRDKNTVLVFVTRDDIEMKIAIWRRRSLHFLSKKPTPFLDAEDKRTIGKAAKDLPFETDRDIGSFTIDIERTSNKLELSVSETPIGTWDTIRGLRLKKGLHPIFRRDRKHITKQCSWRFSRGRKNLGIFGAHDTHELDGVIANSDQLQTALQDD